jgi:ribosomal protein S18 acetylase RimI-like enzyme
MAVEAPIKIRRIRSNDKPWIKKYWTEYWGGDFIVTKGQIHRFHEIEGFVAEVEGEKMGLITFEISLSELEITSLFSLSENKGIGSALVNRVIDLADLEKLRRAWLITTNDNLNALKFWQKRGFKLSKVYPDALAHTRELKLTIPLIGDNGIPLRDEIELELQLA